MTPPVGGRAPLRRVLYFTAATFAGGAVTGVLVYAVGSLVRGSSTGAMVLTTATLTAVVFLAVATAVGKEPPPLSSQAIVPRRWGAYGTRAFAALFGFSLGLGWRTRIGSNLFWVLVAGAALAPRLWVAVLPFLAFGATRTLPIVVSSSVRPAGTPAYNVTLTLTDVKVFRDVAAARYTRYASVLSSVALGVALLVTTS